MRYLAGSSVLVAAALFALTCSFNDSASAHVKKGSFLERHKGFILNMKNRYGTRCCDGHDAFDGLKEEALVDAEGKTHYRVRITSDMKGNPLPDGGVWADVPDDAILLAERARLLCKNLPPNDPDKATCTAPPVNILWANVNDQDSKMGGRLFKPDPGSAAPPVRVLIHCYFPIPRIGQ